MTSFLQPNKPHFRYERNWVNEVICSFRNQKTFIRNSSTRFQVILKSKQTIKIVIADRFRSYW